MNQEFAVKLVERLCVVLERLDERLAIRDEAITALQAAADSRYDDEEDCECYACKARRVLERMKL